MSDDDFNIQEKIYEELQEVKKTTTENKGELSQINEHLNELNSQTQKNTDTVRELNNHSHEPGECGVLDDINEKISRIDTFIEHWPKIQLVLWILIGILIIQVPWVNNNLQEIFESLGLLRYFL